MFRGTFCKTTKELSAKQQVRTSPRDLMQSGGTRYAHEPAAARRYERLNRSTSTAMGVRSPLSAAQVASGLRIEPSQPRDAHSRHTNARPRRSNVVAAARNSQCHVSEVSQRRVSRTTAVGRSGSCAARRGTGLDPGPCSPSTAATSRAVDANICPELGSHAKPGLHTRRLPKGPSHRHSYRGASRFPKIPDLAVAARRLSASQRMHPHIYRSDRTADPVCACAARREGPSHADIEMAIRCRPRTPPTPQLGAEAAPVRIVA